jgi:hypothetical protein
MGNIYLDNCWQFVDNIYGNTAFFLISPNRKEIRHEYASKWCPKSIGLF